ncbi:glycosyltransferase [Bacillus sp. V3B]|uniref:glycosyltransferase n=1 Tax=Bacillus sp. V3B TaxID=2804915 RepID=UPI00210BC0A6|nr:glycosyltransferase [Bacillus sp. V3B]MCQ6275292.1 glycosyltransferase [Bacillus sp. V3B]
MKKNLLFVIPSLAAGGGEKSLINLLSQVDYNSYNVDLLLFHKSGVFLNVLPKQVNIVEPLGDYQTFKYSLNRSVRKFIRSRKIQLAYVRLTFALKNRIIKDTSKAEQYTWKYQSESMDILEKEYDTAIGYLEKSSIYFVVDKVKSKRKIGWIHTNYTNSGMDHHFDQPYFNQLDQIVTVSEECAKSLKENFRGIGNKVKVIYNIVSPTLIHKLSDSSIKDSFCTEQNEIILMTIARLSHEKGLDIAIRSCEQLVDKGYNIKWHVIGEGNERNKLEEMIKKRELEDHFKLLGLRENPYPYLKKADIYIQPSRYEGKSIAIDEAKILHKPIIVTNYETAKDQITNEINGLIVDMNEQGLSEGIERLIQNQDFKHSFINNLSNEQLGTENEINKLYEII